MLWKGSCEIPVAAGQQSKVHQEASDQAPKYEGIRGNGYTDVNVELSNTTMTAPKARVCGVG